MEITILPAEKVKIPDAVRPGYGLYLITTIQVHEGVLLKDYESLISVPVPLPDQNDSWLGQHLHFHYRLGNEPRLEWRIQ